MIKTARIMLGPAGPDSAMSHAATELELYAENDGSLYRAFVRPLQRRLAAAKADGTYESEKAVAACKEKMRIKSFIHFESFTSGMQLMDHWESP